MAAETTPDPIPAEWAAALLESDRRYFEAGAEVVAFPGGSIAVLRGAESLAAGCVAQRIDVARASRAPDSWLEELEVLFRDLGASRARLYLDRPCAALDAALSRRGYRRRVERGFVSDGAAGGVADVDFIRADDERGWALRRQLVAGAGGVSDGFSADPDLWVEMERRRARSGYMRPYLVLRGGLVAAVACAAPAEPLLRLKNVIVGAAHRRRGVGRALATRFAALARAEGFAAAGCFAIEEEPAMGIYGPAGYVEAVTQIEWTRELPASAAR